MKTFCRELQTIPDGRAKALGTLFQLLAGGPGLRVRDLLLHLHDALREGLADAPGCLLDAWTISLAPLAAESAIVHRTAPGGEMPPEAVGGAMLWPVG